MSNDAGGELMVAVATPPGMGAVSVLRVSGAGCFGLVEAGFGKVPEARRAVLAKLRDGAGVVIDEGLLTVFRGPESYTGEDVAEFSGHGGVLVTRRVLQRLGELGARPAEPGEFTQRAFLNGKMDLTQAEAVMDLISAQSELALRSAREQLAGRLGRECEDLRAGLLGVTAHLEAFIDFPEEDIGPASNSEMSEKLEGFLARVRRLLATADQGRILREGVRTVIYGKPNAGKSSLMNRLLGFDRAIVNERAGTTRDMIEESLSLGGIPLRLIDTAGLRESGDEIERQGMAITQSQLERADLVLEVIDLSEPPPEDFSFVGDGRRVVVLNKKDIAHPAWEGLGGLRVCCLTGEGFEELEKAVGEKVSLDESNWGLHSIAVNARHQRSLRVAELGMERVLDGLAGGLEPELVAVDLREALDAVGDISGVVDSEEVLGEIFGSFCIGK